MTLRRAFALARRNVASNRKGAALSALGVAVGIACLVFFAALGRGVSRVVRNRVLPVDQRAIEVRPPAISLGAILGGSKLDDVAVRRLEALRGVAGVYPKMEVRFPASSRYAGNFFGHPLRIFLEVIANGVDPRLVAKDVAPGKRFRDPGPGHPIPVLANSQLLELYNTAFAPSRDLPRLTPSLLTGFVVPVIWGESFVSGASANTEDGLVELVGFSPEALPLGITMPLSAARRLNREHGRDWHDYSSVIVRARTADAVPGLIRAIRRMGFDLDRSQQKLSERVGLAILLVTAALALLSILIVLLAAVNIAHAFFASVRERRREIGILRAVGASERDVQAVLLTEAALVGLAGGLLGLSFGVVASVAVDFAAARFLPAFPFKPASFFAFSWPIVAGGLAVALAAAVGGAYFPARSAAKAEPARALGE